MDRIGRYLEDVDESRFHSDELLIDAVVRNLEVIGEASARIPSEVQAEVTGID